MNVEDEDASSNGGLHIDDCEEEDKYQSEDASGGSDASTTLAPINLSSVWDSPKIEKITDIDEQRNGNAIIARRLGLDGMPQKASIVSLEVKPLVHAK
jgi:hypothetical protein